MSFYTSLSGLKAAQTGLGTTAHNIANAETSHRPRIMMTVQVLTV